MHLFFKLPEGYQKIQNQTYPPLGKKQADTSQDIDSPSIERDVAKPNLNNMFCSFNPSTICTRE